MKLPIDEKTYVSITLVIIFIGAVAWLTNIAATASITASEMVEFRGHIFNELRDIRSRLDEISDRLGSR